MSKPRMTKAAKLLSHNISKKIKEHYTEHQGKAWRHGLEDWSGQGYEFIDDLVRDRARLLKYIEELEKIEAPISRIH